MSSFISIKIYNQTESYFFSFPFFSGACWIDVDFAYLQTAIVDKLKDYNENVQVLIYQTQKYPNFYTIDDVCGLGFRDITSLINAKAKTFKEGYVLKSELLSVVNCKYDLSIADLGITILMMNFARHYSCGQYELYVNMFRSIDEIKILLDFMSKCTKSYIKLPKDLSVDAKYGLYAKREYFNGKEPLKLHRFHLITSLMHHKGLEVDNFISLLQSLHPLIVSGFYNMTSVTDNLRRNVECSNMIRKCLTYEFQKFEISLTYTGDYWFCVPSRAIWFSYFNDRVKYSSYAPQDFDVALQRYKLLNVQIVGYIHDNIIAVIMIEHPNFIGKWRAMIDFFIANNIPIYMFAGTPSVDVVRSNHTICFVRNGNKTIFKLKK